jgi:hypothetical protein
LTIIKKVEQICSKSAKDINQKEEQLLCSLMEKKKNACIIEQICKSNIFRDPTARHLKYFMMNRGVCYSNEPCLALIVMNAQRKDWDIYFHEKGACIYISTFNIVTLSVLARYDYSAKFVAAVQSYLDEEANSNEKPVVKDKINILLFHGFNKSMNINPKDNFFKEAHARRVHRMAYFLKGLCYTYYNQMNVPPEIALYIAQLRYGPLSSHDKEILKSYSPQDYLINHKK